jgi:hypothetical protein
VRIRWMSGAILLGLASMNVRVEAKDRIKVESMGAKPAIVSPTHPKDSRGEVVYESQGPAQKDVPVVPGVLLDPKPVKTVKYSKAMQKAKFAGDVTVRGVITASGDVVDLETVGDADEEAADAAKEAVSQYRFGPARLDGKAVALLFKVEVHFSYH